MTRRTQRIGESFRETLGELIQRQVKDPRVGFVTLTAVRVTPDLSKAHVYYTVLGGTEEREATQAGLESAAPYLRTETARRIRLKTLPQIVFHYDDAHDQGRRIDRILEDIHRGESGGHGPAVELPKLHPAVEAMLDSAAEALSGDGPVHVACHVFPDGDALGSLFAVTLALTAQGREVFAGWGSDDVSVPAQYAFLPGSEYLRRPDDFGTPETALALDCGSVDRLESLAERMQAADVLVNIDHHVSNDEFGDVNVVDSTAASTSELVLRLLLRLGAEITPDIATCLYTGLVTDTGRFSYEAVTPATHAVAGYLIDRGAPVARVASEVYASVPFGYLGLLARVLERARLLDAGPLVVSHITQDDLARSGVGMDDAEDVINVLRSTREPQVALLLKEQPDGKWKGSLRSRGEVDVAYVADQFGGGGHRLAAGFTSDRGLEETVAEVVRILGEPPSGE